jgi:RNA polymerase sigma-70 factor (ECF subfamily)
MSQAGMTYTNEWYLGAESALSLPRTRKAKQSRAGKADVTGISMTQADRRLVVQLRAGEEAAFNELVDRYHGALIRTALNYVADLSVAEEVVQEAWLGVLEGIGGFEGRSSLKSWLFSIVIHKAKDRGVREKRYVSMTVSDTDDADEQAVDPSRFRASGEWGLPPQQWDEITPERLLSSKEHLALLQRAIEELPANLREVLVLRDIEDMDSKDICAMLKITESNLYVRLHRARERVRAALEPHLGTDAL